MTNPANIDQIVQDILADMSLKEKAAIAKLDKDKLPKPPSQLTKETVTMKIIIYLLGLGIIFYCSYLNLYTRHAVDSLKNMFRTYHLQYLATIPAVVAVLFLISAPAAKCPWPFWIVGVLAAMESVIAFTNPQKIYNRMLDWLFDNVSDQAYKIFSIIGIIFGALILTLA